MPRDWFRLCHFSQRRVGDLNRSPRARYFVSVLDERTSFKLVRTSFKLVMTSFKVLNFKTLKLFKL